MTIDLASVDTTSTERDDALTGADFFDTGKFPQAHFVTSGFAKAADGSVEAQGQLTIRDRTQPGHTQGRIRRRTAMPPRST